MPFLTWNFDKSFIYVIIYWVLEIIYRAIFYEKEEFLRITTSIVHDEYIFVILLNIADLLSGFLVLYMKCASKSKKNEDDKNKSARTESQLQSELIYEKASITINKNFFIKLIIICILDYISRSSYWISYAITKVDPTKVSHTLQTNFTISLDIIMRYIFSVFILKIVVYKHRIFSMITIGIGFAILIINDIILMLFSKSKIYEIGETFFFLGIASISGFIYPIEDTFVKQIFSQYYLYPAQMQFNRGIIEFFLLIIITPILYFSFGGGLKFAPANVVIVIVSLIIYTIASFVKAFILLKIIYHFSSQSVSFLIISQSFVGSINRLIQIIKNSIISSEGWKIVLILLEIFGIIMILFACLIYDEIIIINKWDLNANVKKGIINRGELEMKKMFILRQTPTEKEQFIDKDNEIISDNNSNDENNDNDKGSE